MAKQQDEPTKAHGDPLEAVVANSPEENRAQRDSDAPRDATDPASDDRLNNSDRTGGRGSDANGVPAFDEAAGDRRKQQYNDGAELVSKID
jgi:hypothetical protein